MDPHRPQSPEQVLKTGADLTVEVGLKRTTGTYRRFSVSISIESQAVDEPVIENGELFVVRKNTGLPDDGPNGDLPGQHLIAYLFDAPAEHGKRIGSYTPEQVTLDEVDRSFVTRVVLRQALTGAFDPMMAQGAVGPDALDGVERDEESA